MHPSAIKTRIATLDLAATRKFYVSCFGMKVLEEWDEVNDVGCILATATGSNETLLEICQADVAGVYSGLSLQFRTEDLAHFRTLLPPGTNTRGPVARPWGSTYLYLADPNGIVIVVYEGRF
jgi:catechol 2,3-dioxygenase-like lactoylglutathione lyase family enzyme